MNKKIIFRNSQRSNFVHFSLMFVAGTTIESKEELGYSHLIEHLILRSGNDKSLNELFDNNGAFIGGETARDYINFVGYCRVKNFKNIFKAVIDKVFNLKITEEELVREKNVVLVELTQYENGSKTEKSVSDNRLIFKNSMWSEDIIGTREIIKNIDLNKLYKFYIRNIQNGEFRIAVSGPDYLQEELRKINDMLPAVGKVNKINLPSFHKGVTDLSKDNKISEISMYIDTSKFIQKPHDVAILTILSAMLTGVKGSILGDKLRTKNQWIYNIISYPIFHNKITMLKLLTKTPESHKNQVLKVLKENLVDTEDLQNTDLFNKAKKRVSNEALMSCEIKKNELLKTLCREELFNIPSWESISKEVESVSLTELQNFMEQSIMKNQNTHIIIDC
ncbi:MAG: insulinase family protein [Methanobrevibacter sp.]|nr:insulinase family protein [Methanobrevibacter sp.]